MRSWDPPFWIGDRQFTEADLVLALAMVRQFRRLSRTELAATLCENLPWKAPNGKLKVDACRLLLEGLASSGLIELPPKQAQPKGPSWPEAEPLPCTFLEGPLKQYRPVTVDPVELKEQSLWNATIAAYHPLGYRQPFGAYRRYWIRSLAGGESRILGAMLFAAAAKTVSVREAFIGWTALELKRFRYRIVNNSRFLILPGVRIPHLASHALGLVSRRLRSDWLERYGYAPVLLETFVTPPHRGTCYLAANWSYIGETAGLSRKKTCGRKICVPIKMMFVHPLVKNWRMELLLPTPSSPGDEEQEADLHAQS
ncbi:MAG: hypothetical protein DDT29_01888 [Dehalococcoidia bacterium]|nr:hypothetical protein [Bacillota bacterium]